MPHFGGNRQHGQRGGGLLQRLFQGARDRRRSPNVRQTQNDPAGRFDEQGALRRGQPPEPTRGQRGGDANPPTPPDRPNPLDPSTELNQGASQRRQDTRLQFEETKRELEGAQAFRGFGRRRRLREAEAKFARASAIGGTAVSQEDILSAQDKKDLAEGEVLQEKLGQAGALGAEDLMRAKELGIFDNLDPEERQRIENTALLNPPTLPGGTGQPLAVDRSRLTQLAPLDAGGNVLGGQGGGGKGVTQILNPENVDEFLFNVGNQNAEVRNQLFRAISKAGGADAIFESSGGNISEALFLFGDTTAGGSQFGAFGSDIFQEESGGGGDLLEAMGILFGGQPGFQGNNLPGTTEPVPTGLPGVPNGVGQSTQDQQFVQQNLLGSLFQLGFGGQGGTVPLPTGVFGNAFSNPAAITPSSQGALLSS